MTRLISIEALSKHQFADDLWIAVENTVYDMTEFTPNHPGGTDIIHRYAGRDATMAYSRIHSASIIKEGLPASKILGTVDPTTITKEWLNSSTSSKSKSARLYEKPSLESLINTHDFVDVASKTLDPKTWAFYTSGATDLITKARNNSAYADIGLRPRVLIDVRKVDTATTMLGQLMSVPIFCAPAAMAKLVHPEGEKILARGCRAQGIPECVSTNASYPIEDIMGAVSEPSVYGSFEGSGEMPIFFQLYVNKDRKKSEELLRKVEALGVKGIFVTVDAPVAGKREADERIKSDDTVRLPMSGPRGQDDKKGGAYGRIMGAYIDPSVTWNDIPWVRKHTTLPVVLKGIQTAMDARKAMEMGIDGIVLSNHGGRSLDTAPAPILVLLELQKCCPEIFNCMEVYVDGGIMRGTDIFKALCLGAKSVSIGRGFLFALNYGEEGVKKYIEILRDELETTMRMVGVTDLSQVHPGLLNTRAVDHLIPDQEDHPYAKWSPKAKI